MAMNFAILGGDSRNVKLMKVLADTGNKVYGYGILPEKENSNIVLCDKVDHAVTCADYVIGATPFTTEKISSEIILQVLSPGKVFIAGNIPKDLTENLEKKGVEVADILKRDDMAILNAVPTAEGAIQIAMEKLPVTIDKSSFLITGCGKVAKALAVRLAALGGKVTICARKNRDLAWAESCGFGQMSFIELKERINDFTVIYNTVPELIFTEKVLAGLDSDILAIDLASKPGGFDFTAAEKQGIEIIHALSLPGKVAPWTAANNMAGVILNIIKELTEEESENVN